MSSPLDRSPDDFAARLRSYELIAKAFGLRAN